jgi:hypothetical protein
MERSVRVSQQELNTLQVFRKTPIQGPLPSVEGVIQSHDLHDFFELLVILDVKRLEPRPKPLPLLWIDAP